MLIDWLTVLAQVFNFLILAGLLYYFLYGRVLAVLDARRQEIAAQLASAAQTQEKADLHAAMVQKQLDDLDLVREEKLAHMKEEVTALKKEMALKAREEVDLLRTRWQENLRLEGRGLLHNLSQQTGAGACTIARRILQDMAGVDLEERMIETFLDRLQQGVLSSQADREQSLRTAPGKLVIHTAFEIPASSRERITAALREYFHLSQPIEFATGNGVVCGLRVKADGHALEWEVGAYLHHLEASLVRALEENVGTLHPGEKDHQNASQGMPGAEQ